MQLPSTVPKARCLHLVALDVREEIGKAGVPVTPFTGLRSSSFLCHKQRGKEGGREERSLLPNVIYLPWPSRGHEATINRRRSPPALTVLGGWAGVSARTWPRRLCAVQIIITITGYLHAASVSFCWPCLWLSLLLMLPACLRARRAVQDNEWQSTENRDGRTHRPSWTRGAEIVCTTNRSCIAARERIQSTGPVI